MVSRCPRSQMNASGPFARTLSKRNRHQRSHSALAQIHSTTKRLTTLQFAGAEEDGTVSGKEYKNITVRLTAPSPLPIAFSAKQFTCSREHCQANLSARRVTFKSHNCLAEVSCARAESSRKRARGWVWSRSLGPLDAQQPICSIEQ